MPGTILMVGDTKNEDQTPSWTKSFTYREDEYLLERQKQARQAQSEIH